MCYWFVYQERETFDLIKIMDYLSMNFQNYFKIWCCCSVYLERETFEFFFKIMVFLSNTFQMIFKYSVLSF